LSRNHENPFAELPQALVEDLLEESKRMSSIMKERFRGLLENRSNLRTKLDDAGALLTEAAILQTPSFPTSCGIDGSYTIERLVATDVVAAAALAVEGLTPPTETRYWERPRHRQFVEIAPHNDANTVLTSAVMVCQELIMAARAPHDVVFLDGSLRSPIIRLNQALSKKHEVPEVEMKLDALMKESLESYREILESPRSDKAFVGVPKYTSKREISDGVLGMKGHEDRGLLSFILNAGELSKPMPIGEETTAWHLYGVPSNLEDCKNQIEQLLTEVDVFYYKPFEHTPALRIEVARSVAANRNRLAIILEAIKMQSGAPRLMEPYPLYLADRMVKHLSTALPAIRRTITQGIAEDWEGDLGEVYLSMNGHRT
jgi:hypothetical protein